MYEIYTMIYLRFLIFVFIYVTSRILIQSGKWCFWAVDYAEMQPSRIGSIKESPADVA